MIKINWINILFATAIVVLLSWWLWVLGIDDVRKWLLSCVGGLSMEIGLIGTLGFSFKYERSGIQGKIIFFLLTVISFIASIIYSFFLFSPEAYCIPIGILCLGMSFIGIKIFKSYQ